jgi:Ca2+-binding EF-hand superfamily protein
MNRIALLTLALAAATASTAAFAQHAHDRGPSHHRGHGMGGIARLDADHDGRIARAELAGHGRMADRLGKDFAAIDANRDGYNVRTELRAYHERMRPQRMAKRQQRSEQRFAAADLNRDGKLSKTEVAEKMPRLEKRFAWMDDNRDGFLSRSELHPAPRRR